VLITRNLARVMHEPSDGSGTEVGAVHQTDAVEHSHGYDEASVDAMDNFLLLALAELALVSGAILGAVDILPKRDGPLLERVVVTHNSHLVGHCWGA